MTGFPSAIRDEDIVTPFAPSLADLASVCQCSRKPPLTGRETSLGTMMGPFVIYIGPRRIDRTIAVKCMLCLAVHITESSSTPLTQSQVKVDEGSHYPRASFKDGLA